MERMGPLVILALLVTSTAPAQSPELPAGHLYFGLEVQAVQPFGRSLVRQQTMTAGGGYGLCLDYEDSAFIVAGEITRGHFGNDDTYSNPFAVSLRGGPVLGRGRFAPFVSAGLSLLEYGAIGDDPANAQGLSFEVGLLMFRERRWAQVTPFVEYFLPVHAKGGWGAVHASSLSWAAAGVRFQL
jgi:hypothetical protein